MANVAAPLETHRQLLVWTPVANAASSAGDQHDEPATLYPSEPSTPELNAQDEGHETLPSPSDSIYSPQLPERRRRALTVTGARQAAHMRRAEDGRVFTGEGVMEGRPLLPAILSPNIDQQAESSQENELEHIRSCIQHNLDLIRTVREDLPNSPRSLRCRNARLETLYQLVEIQETQLIQAINNRSDRNVARCQTAPGTLPYLWTPARPTLERSTETPWPGNEVTLPQIHIQHTPTAARHLLTEIDERFDPQWSLGHARDANTVVTPNVGVGSSRQSGRQSGGQRRQHGASILPSDREEGIFTDTSTSMRNPVISERTLRAATQYRTDDWEEIPADTDSEEEVVGETVDPPPFMEEGSDEVDRTINFVQEQLSLMRADDDGHQVVRRRFRSPHTPPRQVDTRIQYRIHDMLNLNPFITQQFDRTPPIPGPSCHTREYASIEVSPYNEWNRSQDDGLSAIAHQTVFPAPEPLAISQDSSAGAQTTTSMARRVTDEEKRESEDFVARRIAEHEPALAPRVEPVQLRRVQCRTVGSWYTSYDLCLSFENWHHEFIEFLVFDWIDASPSSLNFLDQSSDVRNAVAVLGLRPLIDTIVDYELASAESVGTLSLAESALL